VDSRLALFILTSNPEILGTSRMQEKTWHPGCYGLRRLNVVLPTCKH